MAHTYTYNVGELRRMIKESSSEFKPVIGAGVEAEDKRNNDKSYKDSEKRAKDFDGGLQKPEKRKLGEKPDKNKTTLDYNPAVEPDESYKKRVQAQVKGYNSELEQKNGIERNADTSGNDAIYDQFTKAGEENDKNKEKLKKTGLASKEMAKENPDAFKSNRLTESLKSKKLIFKHTEFLNESQVLMRIPEEYKRDGQRIRMIDNADNEYVIECFQSPKSGLVETRIISHENKKLMNEQVSRIHELMDYDKDSTSSSYCNESKTNENAAFKEMMDLARNAK